MAEVPDDIKLDYLRRHLHARYEVDLTEADRLDRGVLRLQLGDGRQWVARIFSAGRRTLHQVEGDASILQYLERSRFPAERCVGPSPVSFLGDHSIMLTEFISGTSPVVDDRTAYAFGDILGRLHELPVPPDSDALTRAAGALHHFAPGGGGLEAELAAAAHWLDALKDQIPAANRRRYEILNEQIAEADAGRDLPAALTHPDTVPKNFLVADAGELVLIDWTGAGLGPRIASLALLVWSSSLENAGWAPRRVDAVVAGYRSHITPEPRELERLGAMMKIRPLIFACWRYRNAVRSGRVPDGSEWWWPSDELTQAVANHARAGLEHD